MATIASLAIKVQANIGNTVGEVLKVAQSVGQMSKIVDRSPASLKNMQNAAAGLGAAMDALAKQKSIAADKLEEIQNAIGEGLDVTELVNAYNEYQTGVEKTEEAVASLAALNERASNRMAADILNIVPAVENLDVAFQKLNELKETRAEFQMLTGNMDTMAEAAEKGERMFDVFATNTAAKLAELPPTLGNLSKSLEFLEAVQKKTATFEFVRPETVQSINATKEAVASLANSVAENLSKVTPTLDGIRKACKELEALKGMSANMQAVGMSAAEMTGIFQKAERGVADLVARTAQAKMENAAFVASLILVNMPLLLLKNILGEVWGEAKKLFQKFNEYFNGVPATAAKVTIVLLAIIGLIGYATTSTVTWGAATTYVMKMLKSNPIIEGLIKVGALLWTNVTATASWLAAQLGLNAAWTYFLAATGLILIVGAIAAIVAGVTALVSWWYKAGEATESAEDKTKRLQEATEAYKKSLQDVVDLHQKQIDAIEKLREAAKSPEQKAADRAAELQKLIDEPKRLQEEIDQLNRERISLRDRADSIRNNADLKDEWNAIAEEYKSLVKTIEELQDKQKNLKPPTQDEIAFQEAENVNAQMKDRGIDKYLPQMTAAEEQSRAVKHIEDMYKAGDIDFETRAAMFKNVQKVFQQNDEAFQATKKANEEAAKQTADTIKKFKDMSKTPITAFDELSKQLDAVKNSLTPAEYDAAQQKLLDDLASGLGVSKYFDASDTLAGRQKSLATLYGKLEEYAKKSGLADEELIKAKQKAAKESLGQSEHGKVLLEAMDKLKPAAQKLAEFNAGIDAEVAAAKARGEEIAQNVIDEARRIAQERFSDKNDEDQNNAAKSGSAKPSDNQALVRGSIAYMDFLRRDASKEHVKSIAVHAKEQTQFAKRSTKAIESIAKQERDKNGYEIIG